MEIIEKLSKYTYDDKRSIMHIILGINSSFKNNKCLFSKKKINETFISFDNKNSTENFKMYIKNYKKYITSESIIKEIKEELICACSINLSYDEVKKLINEIIKYIPFDNDVYNYCCCHCSMGCISNFDY